MGNLAGLINIYKQITTKKTYLGLHAFTAEGPGWLPGPGTKIPHAGRCSQKKKIYHLS